MRIHIYPEFGGEDKGDGGVRRVVDAQRKHLPSYGHEIVDSPEEADLIAVHIALPSHLSGRYADKSLVVHNHGLYWHDYEWANWCLKANAGCIEAIRQADAITAPSEWVAQAIRRNSLRRVAAVGHGVDIEDWPYSEEDKGFVLWNKTRIDPVCDPEALVTLAKMAPDISFVSTFGEKLSNLALTGTLPYKTAKRAVSDAAVYLCTAKETFGIGTLEAMACGVPVLGWRWGGQTEIVEHGVTGWLATPGDFDDLLAGLRHCLENRVEMGRRARAVVEERYQWRDVIGQYAVLYERIQRERTKAAPKVSVVVRVHNMAEYLPAALDSVLAQSLTDWECVIVDDASTDDCEKIARGYAHDDKRFRVVCNSERQHVSGAMNVGVAASKGRYILQHDADNILPPDALEVLSSALDSDRKIHVAYGNVEFLELEGKRWHSGWPPEFNGDWQLSRKTADGRPANLVPSGAMFRREVWEAVGGFRRRYNNGEDADFWARATSYGFRAAMVTQADTMVYRNRDDSVSRNEELRDWTLWLPWSQDMSLPPAAVISSKQSPVPSHDRPRVSVVIPVGPEHRELVVDALDSVDAQTFRDWECIIVNDSGSVLRWTPSWVRVLETEGSLGVAAARNLGVAAAKAKFFVPLDADDTLEPDALRQMLQVWDEFGGYVYGDFNEQRESEPMKVWATPEYDPRLLISKGCIHAVTGLYRVEDWQKVGGYDESLPAWEDWDFQLKLANIGVCGTRAPDPIFTYRKDTGFRREDNYANFEQSKQGILTKWRKFFEGKETLMACGGCGGGGGGRSRQSTKREAAPPPDTDYVIIEYVGPNRGARNFRGPSGQVYRFSATETEQRKYVQGDDVEFFTSKRDFRVIELRKEEAVAVS